MRDLPLLQAEHLRVAYGQAVVLHDLSLAVEQGEIVAILGANGAGKSTLLKTIAGLLRPRGGSVVLNGEDVTRMDANVRARRGVTLVPEGRAIFGPLTVEQNLRLGTQVWGYFAGDQLYQQGLTAILELFPALKPRLRDIAGSLSGGQQQMLAIGRALMSKPKLLLLDEPSLGLAPRIIEDIFETLAELNRANGVTVVVAEQNIETALRIAGRGVVLEVGEVAVEGSAAELLARTDVEDVYLGRRSSYSGDVS